MLAKLTWYLSSRNQVSTLWREHAKRDCSEALAMAMLKAGLRQIEVVEGLRQHPKRPMSLAEASAAATAAQSSLDDLTIRKSAAATPTAPELRILRVYDQRPTTADCELAGRTFRVEVTSLASRITMRNACLAATGQMPHLPSVKEYEGWVSAQLEAAERIEQPPEASDDHTDLAFVDLCIGTARDSSTKLNLLRDGRIVFHDGSQIVALQPFLLNRIRNEMPQFGARRLAECLRDLGFRPLKLQIAEYRGNVWTRPIPADVSLPASEIDDDGAAIISIRSRAGEA